MNLNVILSRTDVYFGQCALGQNWAGYFDVVVIPAHGEIIAWVDDAGYI